MARKDCPICNGSGNCGKCGGDGYNTPLSSIVLTFGLGKEKCKPCNSTGKCPRCKGKGHIPDDNKRR